MSKTLDRINPKLSHFSASPRDRFDAGKAQRDSVPLESHAEVVAKGKRADPLAILAKQDKSRLPEVVPLRYGRMSDYIHIEPQQGE